MFTVVAELQRKCTVKHNTLMAYNNKLHASVHQNHHQAPSITKNENVWWWFRWNETCSVLLYGIYV